MRRWLSIGIFSLFTFYFSLLFAADTYDIVMRAGADYRSTHAWTVKATGAVIDLTGNSYQAQFRSAPYPNGTLFAVYSTVVTDAPGGVMRLSLSRRQTVTLSGKSGVWDLKQVAADGTVSYRYGGTVRVIPVVTAP
jgi:hypothetical protein